MRMRSSSLETLLGLPRRKPWRVEFRQTGETNTQPFFGVFFSNSELLHRGFWLESMFFVFSFCYTDRFPHKNMRQKSFGSSDFFPKTFSTWRLFFNTSFGLAFANKRVAWLNHKKSHPIFLRPKVGHLIGPSGANIKVWASRWRWIQWRGGVMRCVCYFFSRSQDWFKGQWFLSFLFLKGHEGRNGFWRYICGLVLSRNQFLSWVCIVCTVSVRCQVIHVGQPLRTSSPWRLLLRSCEQFHGQILRIGLFMLLCNNMFWNGLQWYLIYIDTTQAEGLQLLENKALRGVISLIQGLFFSPERGKSTCTQKRWFSKKTLRLEDIHDFNWTEDIREKAGGQVLGSPIWSQVVDDWELCVSAVSIMSTTHVGPFTIPSKMPPLELVSSGFEIVAGSVAASQKQHFQPGICGSSCTHASWTSLFVLSRRQWPILRTAPQIRRFFFFKVPKTGMDVFGRNWKNECSLFCDF